MQASGPLSAASATRPSTRRAPCRSTWSNTLERSPSSVRCAASGSPRRATWNTTWRDPTATVSSWLSSHHCTHTHDPTENTLGVRPAVRAAGQQKIVSLLSVCQFSSLSTSRSFRADKHFIMRYPFSSLVCLCRSWPSDGPHSLYNRQCICRRCTLRSVPEHFRLLRDSVGLPQWNINYLSLSQLFTWWSFSLSAENEPYANTHSPLMCIHTYTHTSPRLW